MKKKILIDFQICINVPLSSSSINESNLKKTTLQYPSTRKGKWKNFFIKKETLAHVFSCEFCEISKNTFFTEHLRPLRPVGPNTAQKMNFFIKNFVSKCNQIRTKI